MLSPFEERLYQLAKRQGFGSVDENHEELLRDSIEHYLIDVVWKQYLTVRYADADLKSFVDNESTLVHFQNGDQEQYLDLHLLEIIKSQLDPALYNLGDERVEPLVKLLKEGRFDDLAKALAENPSLINRRDLSFRTLLHHAILMPHADVKTKESAIAFIFEKGASWQVKSASNLNAVEIACQSHAINCMLPMLYRRISLYELVKTMLAFNYHEMDCLLVLKEDEQFTVRMSREEGASILNFAIDKRYYRMIKALVLDHAPNGLEVLRQHVEKETGDMKYSPLRQGSECGKSLVSFLLAASASDRNSALQRSNALLAILNAISTVAMKGENRNHAVVGAVIALQLRLVIGHFPVIFLTKQDYELMSASGLWVEAGVAYVLVGNNKDETVVLYQKEGINQSGAMAELPEMLGESIQNVIGFLFSNDTSKVNAMFSEHGGGEKYIQKRFADLLSFAFEFTTLLKKWVDRRELYVGQALIAQVKRDYPSDKPVPLYHEKTQNIIEIAAHRKNKTMMEYLLCNARNAEDNKNLKFILMHSARMDGKLLTDCIVRQPFPNDKSFCKVIDEIEAETGCASLRVERCYQPGTLQRQAKIKTSTSLGEGEGFSEFTILKGLKARYLYYIKSTISANVNDGAMYVAIRDSLVLGQPTLFLNVIRSNRDLTQLKDTKTYLTICDLMKSIKLSDEARQELQKRVEAKAEDGTPIVSVRDAAMYLALVCDIDNNREKFIEVCRNHLLNETMTAAEKTALNAAMKLLSKEDYNQLRKNLIAVSQDPALLSTLKARLPAKNCAFIDIIRTSEDKREVKDTGTFTKWAKEVANSQAPETQPKRQFNLSAAVFFKPDRAKYIVNVCETSDLDRVEAELSFPSLKDRK